MDKELAVKNECSSKSRNLNIESLRVYMMLLIVIMHIGGGSTDWEYIHNTVGLQSGWIVAYRSITFLGVPAFAFISGYYGMNLNLRKFFRMETMTILYGVLIIGLIMTVRRPYFLEVRDLLMPVTFHRLWYYSSYVLLLFIAPIVNAGIRNLDKHTFRTIVIACTIFVYGIRLIMRMDNCTFINLFTIYLIGQYLRLYPIRWIEVNATRNFIVLLIANFVVFFGLGYFALSGIYQPLEGNSNPITFCCAVSLFFAVLGKRNVSTFSKTIARLAPNMLAVYIIHESIRVTGIIDISILNGNLLYVIPVGIIVLLSCSLINILCSVVIYPIVDKIYYKIT